ncbi:mechanosensitive ion channel family protein [Sulfurimonas paralvinellae]|uniref:Mechanosensitive ion channel family protein n=1 Tax=Sulfurimonas paralvinellae TaxID=317658 RepID=A0A7M1BBB9_9BACT|nr:mechanosensitive ion channel family protein [Sulfurimonas paralvinellae]
MTLQMTDANLTQEEISDLVAKQEASYEKALYRVMAKKNEYINDNKDYSAKIYALKKIIAINKRAGNSYAVKRDEVQIQSYLIAKSMNELLRDVLIALDSKDIETFENKLNQYTAEHQKEFSLITKRDYKEFLNIAGTAPVIQALRNNVREYYALQEINNDLISYLYQYDKKMYGLNKFSKFHLVNVVITISSINAVHALDTLLSTVGLSVVKLIIIISLIIIIFFIRKLFYYVFERYLMHSYYLHEYAEEILKRTQRTIDILIIVINLNMIAYVFNDFSSSTLISSFFNILYTLIITYFIYVVINTVALVNLEKFAKDASSVKAELINVGIKIVNFFIFLLGFLFTLYFAGVNLTALLSGLGIGGFAVAFAAKDTISNFFGTLAILASDAFSQGDWVEINGKEGTVVEIGLRVTTLRTFDNALIAIPNGTFASADIKNWNKRKLGRRIKMSIGVKYDSKREDIKNAIVAIREMLQNHPDIATKDTKYEHMAYQRGKIAKLVSKDDLEGVKRTLLVFLDEFADSSINILIYCFSKSVVWEEWLQTKQDVMEKIMEILEENNLEFAFPSLSIYDETKGCSQ